MLLALFAQHAIRRCLVVERHCQRFWHRSCRSAFMAQLFVVARRAKMSKFDPSKWCSMGAKRFLIQLKTCCIVIFSICFSFVLNGTSVQWRTSNNNPAISRVSKASKASRPCGIDVAFRIADVLAVANKGLSSEPHAAQPCDVDGVPWCLAVFAEPGSNQRNG